MSAVTVPSRRLPPPARGASVAERRDELSPGGLTQYRSVKNARRLRAKTKPWVILSEAKDLLLFSSSMLLNGIGLKPGASTKLRRAEGVKGKYGSCASLGGRIVLTAPPLRRRAATCWSLSPVVHNRRQGPGF